MSRALIPVLGAAVVTLAAASLLAGTTWLSPVAVLHALADPRPSLTRLILLEVRLPRVLLAIMVGGILGLSGAALQGLLRNPLAEPGLLGVSAGASLGAVIAIYYGFAASVALATPLFALAGAGGAVAVALWLGRGGGTLALILAGVAVSAIAGAGVALALDLAPNPYAAYEIMSWLMGSLADRGWDQVALAAPLVGVGAALLFLTRPALNALTLGEAQAASLGIDLRTTRLLALAGTALGVGGATAVTGTIGFVGLIAPHLVRPLVGHRPGAALLPATLAGAAIVLAADLAVRLLHVADLKLGVLVSVIGAPFFLWLVLHARRTAT